MARNQGTSSNVNWGICTNTSGKADGTPCSKCQNKEKQAIRASKDFVCEECGEPLTKTPPPTKTPWAAIIGGAVAVVALGVGGYLIAKNNQAKKAKAEEERIADSIRMAKQAEEQRIADSISFSNAKREADEKRIADSISTAKQAEEQRIADSIRIADSLKALKNQKPAPAQGGGASSGSSNWNGVATYSGPMQGGQPNGIGGKLTFKSSYQLDLKDGKGTKLDINASETIENTKFENGKLRQGELHRKDGTRKWFNI